MQAVFFLHARRPVYRSLHQLQPLQARCFNAEIQVSVGTVYSRRDDCALPPLALIFLTFFPPLSSKGARATTGWEQKLQSVLVYSTEYGKIWVPPPPSPPGKVLKWRGKECSNMTVGAQIPF